MDLPKEIKEIKCVNYLPCPNWGVGNTFWVHFHGIKNRPLDGLDGTMFEINGLKQK
jgi:hypothetical protein